MYNITAFTLVQHGRGRRDGCETASRGQWSAFFRAAFAGYLPVRDFSPSLPQGPVVERHARGPLGDLAPYLESVAEEVRCITADASSARLEESGVDVVFADYVCPCCGSEGTLNAKRFRVPVLEGSPETYWEEEDPADPDTKCVSIAAVPSNPGSCHWEMIDNCPEASRPFGSRDVLAKLQTRMRQIALPVGPIAGSSYATVTVGRPGAFRGIYECPACGGLFSASIAAVPTATIPAIGGSTTVATRPATVAGRLDVGDNDASLELVRIAQPSERVHFRFDALSGKGDCSGNAKARDQIDQVFKAIRRLVFLDNEESILPLAGREGIEHIRSAAPLLDKAFECWLRAVFGLEF